MFVSEVQTDSEEKTHIGIDTQIERQIKRERERDRPERNTAHKIQR